MTESTHADLIERLEKAEAGSRFTNEDGIALCKALGLFHRATVNQGLARRALNGSVDATVALVERALPGSRCLVGTRGMKGDRARAAIIPAHGRMVGAKHRTPAMALCIALLKALQSKERSNG